MDATQALNVIAQYVIEARLTLREHQLVQEALGVLDGVIAEKPAKDEPELFDI